MTWAAPAARIATANACRLVGRIETMRSERWRERSGWPAPGRLTGGYVVCVARAAEAQASPIPARTGTG